MPRLALTISVSDEEEARVDRLSGLGRLGEAVARRPLRQVDPWGQAPQGIVVQPDGGIRGQEPGGGCRTPQVCRGGGAVLSQIPCWADLTPEQYRERIAELVEEVEAEARADRKARGVAPLGVEATLRQDPHTRPGQTKRSPAPAGHAVSKAAREGFWEAYSAFVAAFQEAGEKLKAGDRAARFPVGSFPPALPFVSAYPSPPP